VAFFVLEEPMLKPSCREGAAGVKIGSPDPLLQSTAAPLGPVTEAFLGYVHGKRTLMLSLLGLTVFLAVVAVTQGAYDITPGHLLRVLTGSAAGPADIVVWKIRLPRIISAIVVGWGLSLSGLSIQSLLKNPLGSPSTLGISQGAAFGAAAAIVFFGQQMVSVTLFAFAGAMGATAVIMVLAALRRLSRRPSSYPVWPCLPCSLRQRCSFNTSPRTPNWPWSFSGPSAMWPGPAGPRSDCSLVRWPSPPYF
jgi:hypothetical protein